MSSADLREGQRIVGRDEPRGSRSAGRNLGVTTAMQGHNAMGNRAGYNLVGAHHGFGSSSSMNGGLGLAVPPGAAAAPASASALTNLRGTGLGAINQSSLNQSLSQSLNQMNSQSLNQSINYLLEARPMSISPSQLQPVAGPRIAGGAAGNVGSYSLGGATGGTSLSRTGAAGQTALNVSSLNGNSRVVQMGQQLNDGGQLGPVRPTNSLLQQQGQNMSSTPYSPSGNLLAMIQQTRGVQAQAPSANGQLSSLGMARDGSRTDGQHFDMNEFPQLSTRPTSAGGIQSAATAAMRKQATVNALVQQNQEFSIQNEDFPALPGFKAGGNDLAAELKEQQHEALVAMQSHHFGLGRSGGFALGPPYLPHRQHQHQTVGSTVGVAGAAADLNLHGAMGDAFQASHGLSTSYQSQIGGPPGGSGPNVTMTGLRAGSSSGLASGLGQYEHLMSQHYRHHQQQQQVRVHQQPMSTLSAQPSRDVKRYSSQPTDDRYGLKGLLGVIRMTDPDLTTLALGTDLTTLGLNLNSRENLYKTFASPWAEGPTRGEPEYALPACYVQQAPRLQPASFKKFPQDTLFYIFYSMPNDEAQLYAADELCHRGWFYHKELKFWFTRIPNTEVLAKTHSYERGHYFFFDTSKWETSKKENFVVQYDSVETRPQLPPSQPSQPPTPR